MLYLSRIRILLINSRYTYMDNRISALLKKYHSNEISLEELRVLTGMINNISNEELYMVLNKHWEEYDDYLPLSHEKMNALYKNVQSKKKTPLIINMKRYWLHIAASLLLLLASSISVLFYMQYQDMQEIAEQNIIINSGEYGSSSVLLPDGTKVRLNSRSSLSYQHDFGQIERRVKLSGEGYFEVQRDEKKQFVVTTNFMDITVLGTTFNVYAYENKNFQEMTLVEGAVCVATNHPPYKTLHVKPNEKVTYDKRTGELNLESTRNRIETVWIEKKLVFRHDSLKDVFKCLERKFGVTFTVNDENILKDVYTGVFDEENIESILRILQVHSGFEYKIENADISISLK